ncbi:MAG: hypothetical protein MUF08_04285 [Burkholderiaceae bacterium]|nr:hypothetical protein [Burkholderiaceae bacterium]MCU0964280.1 hypothetical protein [Burkholderiaceae bacterium]
MTAQLAPAMMVSSLPLPSVATSKKLRLESASSSRFNSVSLKLLRYEEQRV